MREIYSSPAGGARFCSGLREASAYREWLPLQRLQDEVADDPAVVHVHARPECVEDPCHSHLNAFLEQRAEEQSETDVLAVQPACTHSWTFPVPCASTVSERVLLLFLNENGIFF